MGKRDEILTHRNVILGNKYLKKARKTTINFKKDDHILAKIGSEK